MTIPRGRKIRVGSTDFRWRLSSRRVPYDRDSWSYSSRNTGFLTVQLAGGPGRVCQRWLSWTSGRSVTPESVSIIIRMMMEDGWDPHERGASLVQEDRVDVDLLPTRENLLRQVMES